MEQTELSRTTYHEQLVPNEVKVKELFVTDEQSRGITFEKLQ